MRMGLNRDCLTTTCDNPKRQALSRRLWWSAYLRDALTAMWSQLPPSVGPEDFDVPYLQVKDFDLGTNIVGSSRPTKHFPPIFDIEFRERLAATFIDICSLSLLLARVLRLRFTPFTYNNIISNVPGYLNSSEEAKCEFLLQQWLYSRSAVYSTKAIMQQEHFCDEMLHDSLHRQTLFIHLLYHVTTQSIYVSQKTTEGMPGNVFAKAQEVAQVLTKIFTTLSQKKDLTQVFPATAQTGLLDSILVHNQTMQSPLEDLRLEGWEGRSLCMKYMAELESSRDNENEEMAFQRIQQAGIHKIFEKASNGPQR